MAVDGPPVSTGGCVADISRPALSYKYVFTFPLASVCVATWPWALYVVYVVAASEVP